MQEFGVDNVQELEVQSELYAELVIRQKVRRAQTNGKDKRIEEV
jgi:hypothetical protein